MAYNAQNSADIKNSGDLPSYIAHQRNLIASLEEGEVTHDTHGDKTASIAHLHGSYGNDAGDGGDNVVVWLSYGDWSKKFPIASFGGDYGRALAYAKKVLSNKLHADAQELLHSSRASLQTLESAQ